MATRTSQWHAGYNPVTHTGQGGPIQGKPTGVKITPKVVVSNLTGAACIPSETAAAAFPTPQACSPKQHLPAKMDHLTGGGCTPGIGGCTDAAQQDSPGMHASGRASPKVNLRAAVDHLHGVACCVQQVAEVATADAPLPQVQRGMATKLTKDRMIAQQAREHMNSSRLYALGGGGYTPVSLTGPLTSSSNTDSSPREH